MILGLGGYKLRSTNPILKDSDGDIMQCPLASSHAPPHIYMHCVKHTHRMYLLVWGEQVTWSEINQEEVRILFLISLLDILYML